MPYDARHSLERADVFMPRKDPRAYRKYMRDYMWAKRHVNPNVNPYVNPYVNPDSVSTQIGAMLIPSLLIPSLTNDISNSNSFIREGESEGKPKKKITLIDEAFILKMHDRWDEKLSATEVDDQIELAQAHKSFDKWNGKQVYVNNWLKRQAEGATNGKSKQPLAFDNRIDKYREAAKTDN